MVVPCKKITTIRAVTARVTLRTFKDVAPKKMRIICYSTDIFKGSLDESPIQNIYFKKI